MFRFSLAALLGLVSFAALGCAPLANATDVWREFMVTFMLGLILTATLAAIVWRGDRRALATGFAVFGWAYLLLAFVSALGFRDDLLTEKSLSWVYHAAHGTDQPQIDYVDQAVWLTGEGTTTVRSAGRNFRVVNVTNGQLMASGNTPSYENFADIGHSLWAILIACLGAVVASLLSSDQRRRIPRAAG